MNVQPRGPEPDGVLIVDKPSGPTSFDVVAQTRRVFRTRKVGHCGTLDPFASGVLVLVLGEASKLASLLTNAQKGYRATIHFGHSTDSLDRTGQVTHQQPLAAGWSQAIDWSAVLDAERARTSQVPPQFSAIKREGRRAYARARSGLFTELEPRAVNVETLRYVSHDDLQLVIDLVVSKGYYVRSLARDLCAALDVPGHLAELRRTQSGCFTLDDAIAWPSAQNDAAPPLLGIEAASLRALPTATLTPEGTDRARKGQKLTLTHFEGGAPPRNVAVWLDPDGRAVALGEEAQPSEETHPGEETQASVDEAGRAFRVKRGFKPRV